MKTFVPCNLSRFIFENLRFAKAAGSLGTHQSPQTCNWNFSLFTKESHARELSQRTLNIKTLSATIYWNMTRGGVWRVNRLLGVSGDIPIWSATLCLSNPWHWEWQPSEVSNLDVKDQEIPGEAFAWLKIQSRAWKSLLCSLKSYLFG